MADTVKAEFARMMTRRKAAEKALNESTVDAIRGVWREHAASDVELEMLVQWAIDAQAKGLPFTPLQEAEIVAARW